MRFRIRARERLVGELRFTGEWLRGSLLERTVRHTKGCPKCARGEGHQVFVPTVTYAGGRTRQFSVRRERVAEVRRWLDNYQKLKQAIEIISKGTRRIGASFCEVDVGGWVHPGIRDSQEDSFCEHGMARRRVAKAVG